MGRRWKLKSLSRVPLFIHPRAAFRAAGEYRSSRSMHRRCATRNSFSGILGGEAFWKFTTGSNGVEQKCQSRLRGSKKDLCRFVSLRRYVERRDDIPRLSTRISFRFAFLSHVIPNCHRLEARKILNIYIRTHFVCNIYLSRLPYRHIVSFIKNMIRILYCMISNLLLHPIIQE